MRHTRAVAVSVETGSKDNPASEIRSMTGLAKGKTAVL
jgi:hypothetical protein